jgi:hypothetical protein
MIQTSNQTTAMGEPTEAQEQRDRYLFGNLESFGKNRQMLEEVNWGGSCPSLAGCGNQLGSEELDLANDFRPGMLRYRDDVNGWVKV